MSSLPILHPARLYGFRPMHVSHWNSIWLIYHDSRFKTRVIIERSQSPWNHINTQSVLYLYLSSNHDFFCTAGWSEWRVGTRWDGQRQKWLITKRHKLIFLRMMSRNLYSLHPLKPKHRQHKVDSSMTHFENSWFRPQARNWFGMGLLRAVSFQLSHGPWAG